MHATGIECADMNLQWKTIARDIVIIFILTFIGGICVALIGDITGMAVTSVGLALSNLLFGSAGFAYSSAKISENRWSHLAVVALGVWVLSSTNVMFGLVTPANWLVAIIPVFVFMAIGGAIGALIAKRKTST